MLEYHTRPTARKPMPFSLRAFTLLTLALALLAAASAPYAAAQPGAALTPTTNAVAGQPGEAGDTTTALPPIDLFPVPLPLKRRAAQFLEDMRGSPLAPGWEQARLSLIVRPLYRLDMTGVAYYEFPVMLPAVQAPGIPEEPRPAGYIIVATGEHDYPIAHWSYSDPAPTAQMISQAQASGAVAVKFFKLDTLAYAAEDSDGKRVAKLGAELVRITELNQTALEALPSVIETRWDPNQEGLEQAATPAQPDLMRVNGDLIVPPFRLIPWASWNDLKLNYGSAYLKLIDAIRAKATPEWEYERLAIEHGEILTPGQRYVLALLESAGAATPPQITLLGPGAAAVQTEMLEGPARPRALQLDVAGIPTGQALPLEVQIDYDDGRQETIKFVAISAVAEVYLPRVTAPETNVAPASAAPERQANGWGEWVIYAAGSVADQRLYRQINSGESPNNDVCLSGCGATAWAMLFGWADYQAGQNRAPWSAHRWLYRQNGGRGSVDAVAPTYLDAGVKNMIWEIRNAIGTFCGFGSEAATAPWNMEYAGSYIAGRDTLGLTTSYNVLGNYEARIAQDAINSIVKRKTPVIIGTGTLSHYPLAFQYAWRSRRVWTCTSTCAYKTEYQQLFYVNQGWGGEGNSWVPINTWFAGQIWP